MIAQRKAIAQRIAGLLTDVVFRHVDLRVHPEAHFSGPVLAVANHFGGLSDAVLLVDALPVMPRILARDVIWRLPVARSIMRGVRAIPVHRPVDQRPGAKQGAESQSDMFASCYEALAAGDLVLIFPEGVTVETPHIAPLKTGAARIALGALAAGMPYIDVLPVGLHYADKSGFRSSALVNVGAPIRVTKADGNASDSAAVRWLTGRIEARLRDVAPDFPDWLTARAFEQTAEVVLHDVDAGPTPQHYGDRMVLAGRLARHCGVEDSVDRQEIVAAAVRYHAARNAIGADDLAVRRTRTTTANTTTKTTTSRSDPGWSLRALISLVLLPYALLGAALVALPWLLIQAVRQFRLAPAVQASITPGLALLGFGGEYAWLIWRGWSHSGLGGASAVFLLAPFFAACAALVSEQVHWLWHRWRRRRVQPGVRADAAWHARVELSDLAWRWL